MVSGTCPPHNSIFSIETLTLLQYLRHLDYKFLRTLLNSPLNYLSLSLHKLLSKFDLEINSNFMTNY